MACSSTAATSSARTSDHELGGGNTSAKVTEPDAFDPGRTTETLYVKGSGGDLGSLGRNGLASLSLARLRALAKVYRGRAFEDEMVPLVEQCVVHGSRVAPSIDTSLHTFLPFHHCDHLHPDAVIAIAASADGERLTQEIWGGEMGWIPWLRPGFGLRCSWRGALVEHPGLRGIVLQNHGCSRRRDVARVTRTRSSSSSARRATGRQGGRPDDDLAFGRVTQPPAAGERRARAAAWAPTVRGLTVATAACGTVPRRRRARFLAREIPGSSRRGRVARTTPADEDPALLLDLPGRAVEDRRRLTVRRTSSAEHAAY